MSIMTCPSDWTTGSEYCCTRRWTESCGESCAETKCENIGDTVFLDLDHSASPYTCCNESIKQLYPKINDNRLTFYEGENICNKQYNGHLMVVGSWMERSIFEHFSSNNKYWNGIYYNITNNMSNWDTTDGSYYYWSTGGGWDAFSKMDPENDGYSGACLYMETTDAHSYFFVDDCDNGDDNICTICHSGYSLNYGVYLDIECSSDDMNDINDNINKGWQSVNDLKTSLFDCYSEHYWDDEYVTLFEDAYSLYYYDNNDNKNDAIDDTAISYGLSIEFDSEIEAMHAYYGVLLSLNYESTDSSGDIDDVDLNVNWTVWNSSTNFIDLLCSVENHTTCEIVNVSFVDRTKYENIDGDSGSGNSNNDTVGEGWLAWGIVAIVVIACLLCVIYNVRLNHDNNYSVNNVINNNNHNNHSHENTAFAEEQIHNNNVNIEMVSQTNVNCIICATNSVTTVNIPCGHQCYCHECWNQIQSRNNGNHGFNGDQCPICRKSGIKVYVTYKSGFEINE